ncbi:hypothetical protein Esti_006128 [Eimeria stiedai]
MSGANQDAYEASASGLLLIVSSSAALHEAASFGGSLFLHVLVEQLLGHLGTCSLDIEAKPAGPAASDGDVVSWRCRLENKYYTATIKAFLLQQDESRGLKQKPLFRQSPEAVVFICTKREQQLLHDARRALSRSSSQEDGEPERYIDPLPFMKEICFNCRKRQQGEEQVDPLVQTTSSVSSSWWVRDVPLKFIISLHCNQGIIQRTCCSNSCSLNDEVETVVWNIGGDVFLEGMELCFTAQAMPRTAATSKPTEAFITSIISQQNHRLKKVAEGLQCHMWPGLSRRGGGQKSLSENSPSHGSSQSSCNTSENTSKYIPLANSNKANEEGRHDEDQKSEDAHCKAKQSNGVSALKKEEPLGSVEDADAFDALAAAMLDLKQRGSSLSLQDRRRTAMRLAAQLAALTIQPGFFLQMPLKSFPSSIPP